MTRTLGTLAGLVICAAAGAQSSQVEDAARVSIGPGIAVRFVEQNNARLKVRFRKSVALFSPGHYVVGVGYSGALNADSRMCRLEFDATSDRAYIIVPHRSAGGWGASLRSYELGHDSRAVVDRKFDPLVDIECKFD